MEHLLIYSSAHNHPEFCAALVAIHEESPLLDLLLGLGSSVDGKEIKVSSLLQQENQLRNIVSSLLVNKTSKIAKLSLSPQSPFQFTWRLMDG